MIIIRKTDEGRLALPREATERFPDGTVFEVRVGDEEIVIRPVDSQGTDRIRADVARKGIDEDDVRAAVDWARRSVR